MTHPAPTRPVSPPDTDLETAVSAVETRLAALGDSLRSRDSIGIDVHATELHRALAMAVDQFAVAARQGSVPPALRNRLANTSGQVAAQRESLARATAALDRAIEVLMPRDGTSLYSTLGGTDRAARGGSILA
jgi:hypothetical protein